MEAGIHPEEVYEVYMEEGHVVETLKVASMEQFIQLFGVKDENVDLIRRELDVDIRAQGEEIQITGESEKARLACLVLQRLLIVISQGEAIDKTRIRYAIELAAEGNAERIDEIMRDVVAITYKGRPVKCKTLGQKNYVETIRKNTCVFAVGPAGTGKTYLAIAMAVVALKNKDVEKIILTRPAVEAGEKLGFLPGDLQQKVDPYLRPLYDALNDMMGLDAFQRLSERGAIEVAPLAYMRGRTLNDAFIILDEAQNTTSEQMKMFLTRMGTNSKMIINGDVSQTDLPAGKTSGLIEALNVLKGIEGIGMVTLSPKDVVRHELVQAIVRAYEKYKKPAQEQPLPPRRFRRDV